MYSYCWKHSKRMRRLAYLWTSAFALFLLGIGYVVSGKVTLSDLIMALVLAAALFAMVPYVAKLRTKKRERTLSIEPTKICTQIGWLRGDVPWTRVDSLFVTAEHIFILGRNLNGFAIPRRAFQNDEHRREFIRSSEQYFAVSRTVA